MVEVVQSSTYQQWFAQLKRKDKATAARINVRVLRLANGNPGDVKPIGEGLSEPRFTFRAGVAGLLPAGRRPADPVVGRR